MKTVFFADDMSEFDSAVQCQEYEALCNAVKELPEVKEYNEKYSEKKEAVLITVNDDSIF